jgi:endoglucanase
MEDILRRAGIDAADGFAVNVSSFQTTEASIQYGQQLRARLGGKAFVVDTSRNGNGPAADNEWCNPPGRALGTAPTGRTGVEGVDAFLWVKRPGESDGACNGGPAAGQWWRDKALELASNAGIN